LAKEKCRLEKRDMKIFGYQSSLEEARGEIRGLKNKLADKERIRRFLVSHTRDCEREISEWKRKHSSDLKKARADSRRDIADLILRAEQERESNKEAYDSMKKKLDTKIQELSLQLDDKVDTIETLNKEQRQQRRTIKILNDKIAADKQINSSQKRQIASLEKQNERLQFKNEQLLVEKSEQEASKQDLINQVQELEQQLQSKEEERLCLVVQIETFSKEIEKKKWEKENKQNEAKQRQELSIDFGMEYIKTKIHERPFFNSSEMDPTIKENIIGELDKEAIN